MSLLDCARHLESYSDHAEEDADADDVYALTSKRRAATVSQAFPRSKSMVFTHAVGRLVVDELERFFHAVVGTVEFCLYLLRLSAHCEA